MLWCVRVRANMNRSHQCKRHHQASTLQDHLCCLVKLFAPLSPPPRVTYKRFLLSAHSKSTRLVPSYKRKQCFQVVFHNILSSSYAACTFSISIFSSCLPPTLLTRLPSDVTSAIRASRRLSPGFVCQGFGAPCFATHALACSHLPDKTGGKGKEETHLREQ